MSSSRKLSTDEVDALMEGLQSGVISTEGNISLKLKYAICFWF